MTDRRYKEATENPRARCPTRFRLPSKCMRLGGAGVLFQELHGVSNGLDLFRRVVWDFAAKLFFERHDEFDRIQAVCAQIIDEARRIGDLFGFNAQVLDHDLLHARCDVAHTVPLRIYAVRVVRVALPNPTARSDAQISSVLA
jgi:hypothetical protein